MIALPHLIDADAETAMIGAILNAPEVLDVIAERIQPDDLYLTKNQAVYDACLALHYQNADIDILTVAEQMKRQGTFIAAGGMAYLAELINLSWDREHGVAYARIVKRLGWLRKFLGLAADATKRSADPKSDPTELYAWLQEQLQHMDPHSRTVAGTLYGWEFADWYTAVIDRRIAEREAGNVKSLDWPWATWNKLIRPIVPGEVGLFVAGDGMGKTTYLNQIAEHWATCGVQVQVLHAENDKENLADRRTVRWSGVPLAALEDGSATPAQRELVTDIHARIALGWGQRLHYQLCAGWTMQQVIAHCDRERKQGLLDVLVLDYFDKIYHDLDLIKAYRDEYKRDALMMERLKSWAQVNGVPVLTASQMTKFGKKSGATDRSDMRGSGEKSDKAQLVILLHREKSESGIFAPNGRKLAEPGEYSPEAVIRVDKQNRGKTGSFRQFFDGSRYRILDMDEGKI